MKTYTKEQLADILSKHASWLKVETEGVPANLDGANLRSANLDGANLDGASLRIANLDGANLRSANLHGANLDGASLYGANLDGANLDGANLDGANLDGANLRSASLYGANLYGASLDGANLDGANLDGANLDGANLSAANMNAVKGLKYAACGWSDHGECGRVLIGVWVKGVAIYHCGCFCGSIEDLRAYIDRGSDRLNPSRSMAADFVAARLAEMKPAEEVEDAAAG